jgi:hypothetical protein
MPRKVESNLEPIAAQPEQPAVFFTLEMHEKTRGLWRRRAGTPWRISLNRAEYEILNRCISALGAPEKAAHNRLRRKGRKKAAYAL